MPIVNDFPSYEKLFGDLDFKKSDPARAVFSPAAYLADLIGFVDYYFESPDLFDQPELYRGRRQDIKSGIPLDAHHTFTTIPYLDVVIRILEQAIGEAEDKEAAKIYDHFLSARYPFELPADLDHERIKRYAKYLRVQLTDIYPLFADWHQGKDADIMARESLGLSAHACSFLTTAHVSEADIAADYGSSSLSSLTDINTFLRVTGISGAELYELLFQQLSLHSLRADGSTEREAARAFFIHQDLGGYVGLDEEEQHLIWVGEGEQIPAVWYDRVSRLLRLADQSGMTTSELDQILRTCCGHVLDLRALRIIAVVQHLRTTYDLPVSTICVLAGSAVDPLGHGDSGDPMDLFHKTFNGRYAHVDKSYLEAPGHAFVPQSYAQYRSVAFQGDLLDLDNKPLRRRLLAGLGFSEKDFALAVEAFREAALRDGYASAMAGSPTAHTYAALYRVAQLRHLLELPMAGVLELLKLLALDPYLRVYPQFDILIDEPDAARDTALFPTFRMLEQASATDSLWLIQITLAVGTWMQADGLSVEDLREMLQGTAPDPALREAQTLAMLQAIHEQMKPQLFAPKQLLAAAGDERSAKALHEMLISSASQIVSPRHAGILLPETSASYSGIYQALQQLSRLQASDMTGLGLEEKILDHLYNQLIRQGYLQPDGHLVETHFPAQATDFRLTTDFSAIRVELYELLHALYLEERSENEGESESEFEQSAAFSVFPSDLNTLSLSMVEAEELYSNLVFLSYIDSDGTVLQVSLFASKVMPEEFVANTPLQAYAAWVFEQMADRIERFSDESLKLDPQLFDILSLGERETEGLLQNLQFNGYLDDQLTLIDKHTLVALQVANFDLALEYYPHRHKILAALKAAIGQFKSQFFLFSREFFTHLADRMYSDLVYRQVAEMYFPTGTLSTATQAFFSNPENATTFLLPIYLGETAAEAVFKHLSNIVSKLQQLQVSPKALTEIGLDEQEQTEALHILHSAGWINANKYLEASQIEYFLQIHNALTFQVDEYQDHQKDLFFVLHGVALAADAQVRSLHTALLQVAADQKKTLLTVFQEHLEVDYAVAGTLAPAVWGPDKPLVETVVVPVLEAAGSMGRILALPPDNIFLLALRRLRQLALLASRLSLSQAEMEVALYDQHLVDKFPEPFHLPAGVHEIDALLQAIGDTWETDGITYHDPVFVFNGSQFWAYDSASYELILLPAPLAHFAPELRAWHRVDAAFTDLRGTFWLISGSEHLCKTPGASRWESRNQVWGELQHGFIDPASIDSSFVDHEGRSYLFAGDEYVRYSGTYETVDEGYPRKIADHWKQELSAQTLPPHFYQSIDASFTGPDHQTYLFSGSTWVSSPDYSEETLITDFWGRVHNEFDQMEHLDAAFSLHGSMFLFKGGQVIAYTDHLANPEVRGVEGSLLSLKTWLPALPDAFEVGVDAVLEAGEGKIDLFRDGTFVQMTWPPQPDATQAEAVDTREVWGIVTNHLEETGIVDAAFVGLDGKTYLFSGTQYYRYSKEDYSYVDEGYPRSISRDWGGLQRVVAAFVLDGKTYVFGPDPETGAQVYFRYSTRDYLALDEGYPLPVSNNFWNLPERLVTAGFTRPDAVFTGQNGLTYLFSGSLYVTYNQLQRWWSQPEAISTGWDSIPFQSVSAAFCAKNGQTYLFTNGDSVSEGRARSLRIEEEKCQFVRFSDSRYEKIDNRYPKVTRQVWGKISNQLVQTGRVDAAITLSTHSELGSPQRLTYLFSGGQYVRYSDADFQESNWPKLRVDEGYPRSIELALHEEPHFLHLDRSWPLHSGIDALVADDRHIYLFQGKAWHIISNSLSASYESLAEPSAVMMDRGTVFLEEAGAWKAVGNLNQRVLHQTDVSLPPLLRKADPAFQRGLDAVLRGSDGHTYLFRGAQCHQLTMNRTYPTRTAWGRVRNNIDLDNRLDAAFVGTDGVTYVFRGDQFARYAPGVAGRGAFLMEQPQTIAGNWGGLRSVRLAFVKDDKTYLMEAPDDQGVIRYVCYPTSDYRKPLQPSPQETDISFWEIPATYREDGFDEVHAVLVEGDNLFLIKDQEYIHFNTAEHRWSYPRPLTQGWQDIPFNRTDFQTIRTAFTDQDGGVYFFSDEAFVHYERGALISEDGKSIHPIRAYWGLIDNHFAASGHLDAAFVDVEGRTYLFSGDQYIRYSGQDYRFVDPGYPLDISNGLRNEPAFVNLPEGFEKMLVESPLRGIVATPHSLYIFTAGQQWAISRELTHTFPLNHLGHLRNVIQERGKVDAAFTDLPNHHSYLLAGDQVIRYTGASFTYADEGYPKPISHLAEALDLHEFPAHYGYDLGAALNGTDDHLYFFKGKTSYSSATGETPVAGRWGVIYNQFDLTPGVDAVISSVDGAVYAFRGSQFVKYSSSELAYIDPGYPQAIRNNWSGLPVEFENGLTGAFVLAGKTYLLRSDQYVRYSRADLAKRDPMYPQKLRRRFGPLADIRLGDIYTIARFKKAEAQFAGEFSLTQLLHPNQVTRDPYAALSEMFDWDIEEVKWLQRHQVPNRNSRDFEENMTLESILHMQEIFKVSGRMELSPSILFGQVWQVRYGVESGHQSSVAATAEALYGYLRANNSEKDWAILSSELHDIDNTFKRDLLLSYAIRVALRGQQITNARDLYAWLLIDSQMSSCAKTSFVQEAISAVQLYIHRYFSNLESVSLYQGDEAKGLRDRLKQEWEWRKTYRVWEANRRVFLYPENYLRPELRAAKTAAFETLEQDLLQNEVTEEGIEQAYRRYLDEYTEVSRLNIAGGYVYDDPVNPSDKRLILFGHTKSDPPRYYYRTALFVGSNTNSVVWDPWVPVEIQIDAKKVYPVYAFGRMFVFWGRVEKELIERDEAVITSTESGNTQTISSDNDSRDVLKIYYSFYNLNREWSAPQLLDTEIKGEKNQFPALTERLKQAWTHPPRYVTLGHFLRFVGFVNEVAALAKELEEYTRFMREQGIKPGNYWPINSFELFVENGSRIDGQSHDNIVINVRWSLLYDSDWSVVPNLWKETVLFEHAGYHLTPELYTQKVQSVPSFSNPGVTLFRSLFAASERISVKRMAMLGSFDAFREGLWFCFDHKGGSFLVKPAEPVFDGHPRALVGNTQGLPAWPHVDAAVGLPDGTTYFFLGTNYTSSAQLDTTLDIGSRWGLLNETPVESVDAAYRGSGPASYLFSGNRCFKFPGIAPGSNTEISLQQFFQEIDFPEEWSRIDAAFAGSDDRLHLFSGNLYAEVVERNQSQLMEVRTRWGRTHNSLTDPNDGRVLAALNWPDAVYLFTKTQVFRYESSLEVLAPGYPQPLTVEGILAEFGVSDAELPLDSFQGTWVTGAYEQDGRLFFTLSFSSGEFQVLILDPEEKTATLDIQDHSPFGASFYNQEGVLQLQPAGGTYQGTFVRDGRLYVFQGALFISTEAIPDSFEALDQLEINWNLATHAHLMWGTENNIITRENRIDAAWTREDHTYLFCEGEYVRYTGHDFLFMDPGYPKSLQTNVEQLPAWSSLDAAFTASDGKSYFFREKIFVSSDDLRDHQPVGEVWGQFTSIFVETPIDAAYTYQNKLFLIGGNQYVRYTLKGGVPQRLPDKGYPAMIPFLTNTQTIDAVMVLRDKVYVFLGSTFVQLPQDKELKDEVPNWSSMIGTWGNLPQDFKSGFDASPTVYDHNGRPKELFLIRQGQYVNYDLAGEGALPFVIAEVDYDIIRLTTSTGYQLNQRMFTGGVMELLSLRTQELDEIPKFSKEERSSSPSTIAVRSDRVRTLPVDSHLDFYSANGQYYWEMFFHAPTLIAQHYSSNQQFAEARAWYEYIYNPSEPTQYWRFLPFMAVDIAAIVDQGRLLYGELPSDIQLGLSNNQYLEVLEGLAPYAPAFLGDATLSDEGQHHLESLVRKPALARYIYSAHSAHATVASNLVHLRELWGLMERLPDRYRMLQTTAAEVQTYLNDPFDPHAIAALRPLAYRKQVVMNYIDNLLDWGDMLFRQYTAETINEARMLYVLAYDLLGERPESLGVRTLMGAATYQDLYEGGINEDAWLELENLSVSLPVQPIRLVATPPHDAILGDTYFYVPENDQFLTYWDRVEDRLYKIRHCLNIMGIAQPLALFEPPIDPMALVSAASAGGSLGQVLAGLHVPIPHYRFTFMIAKAREVVQRLNELGGELLAALEKKDSEAFSVLQQRQEGMILEMTRSIRDAQRAEARHSAESLRYSLASAELRKNRYQTWIDNGMSSLETGQITMISIGAGMQGAAAILKLVGGILAPVPDVSIGPPFASKADIPAGTKLSNAMSLAGDALETGGEAFSMVGEALGIRAQFERSAADWQLQHDTTAHEIQQITAQIQGAEWQIQVADREREVLEKQIEHNASLQTLYQQQFTNENLYAWMSSRLSSLYFQTYQMAYDMARYAERAFQYERGIPEQDVSYIHPVHWDSRRKGLMAGYHLAHDLDRMEMAFMESHTRRLEISSLVSLVEIDPLAFLNLKATGTCEFQFSEALFDYEFQGHYCRQIKTLSVTFEGLDGQTVHATLTQLSHKTIMEPDIKAVKYLLNPLEQPPLSVRSDWRASQQIALSHVDEYEKNNGLFELRYDDERYLPFEGTGSVSMWRLDVFGKKGRAQLAQLKDVEINIKYSAIYGGNVFAQAVRGLLKPFDTAVLIRVGETFSSEWNTWLRGTEPTLTLPLTRELLPAMSNSRVAGIYTRYDLNASGQATFSINGDSSLSLKDGKYLETPALSIASQGTALSLAFKGNRSLIKDLLLVLSYKAKV